MFGIVRTAALGEYQLGTSLGQKVADKEKIPVVRGSGLLDTKDATSMPGLLRGYNRAEKQGVLTNEGLPFLDLLCRYPIRAA